MSALTRDEIVSIIKNCLTRYEGDLHLAAAEILEAVDALYVPKASADVRSRSHTHAGDPLTLWAGPAGLDCPLCRRGHPPS